MTKAIIYTRVSTEEQAQNNTSLEDQRSRGKFYAAMRGLEVAGVYEDAGISGTRYATRPALLDALAAIERKDAEILIVLKIDRLGRSANVILQIATRIDRAGGQIVTCDGQEFGGSPSGKMFLTLFAGMAEFEKDSIRERMRNGKQARATSGVQPARSMPPYGYHIVTKKDIEEGRYPAEAVGTYRIIEANVPTVLAIFALYDDGTSLRQIARTLETQGTPTPKGGKVWYASTVRSVLENPAFKGEASYGRKQTQSGEDLMQVRNPEQRLACGRRFVLQPENSWTKIAVPAIVDAALWERCRVRLQGNIADKQALLGGNPGRKFTLTGLVCCSGCGWRMGANRRQDWGGGKIVRFRCEQNTECKGEHKYHAAAPLEMMVKNALRTLTTQPEGIRAALAAYEAHRAAQQSASESETTRRALQAKLAELETELKDTKRAMLAAIRAGLSEDDFAGELEAIAKKRGQMQAQIAALGSAPEAAKERRGLDAAAKLAEVAEATERVLSADETLFTPGEKQAVLRRVIDRIVPTEAGADIYFKSETVHFVKMQCTVSGIISIQIAEAVAKKAA